MSGQSRRVLCSTFSMPGLLLAGFVACSNAVGLGDDKVTGVTITPASMVMNVGGRVALVAVVTAGPGQSNRGVRWATGNAGVATVDTNGVVASLAAGTAMITATALADTTIKATASVTVAGWGPEIFISAINQNGRAADLSNISGQLDVVVAIDGDARALSRVDLLLNCGGADTVVATQTLAGASPAATPARLSISPVTLSFNTAAFRNGRCILKVLTTIATGTVVASASVAITLNNPTSVSAP